MRVAGLIRVVVFIFTIVTMWVFLRSYTSFSRKTIRLPRWLGITPKDIREYLPSPSPSSAHRQDVPGSLFPVLQAPEKYRCLGSSQPTPLWQWQWQWQCDSDNSRSRIWAAPLSHSDCWGLLTLSLLLFLLGSLDHAEPCLFSLDPHPAMSQN